MEQTAVDFLIEKLSPTIKKYIIQEGVIEEAKEIEKQRIAKAFNDGRYVGIVGHPGIDGNHYYEQVYKSK